MEGLIRGVPGWPLGWAIPLTLPWWCALGQDYQVATSTTRTAKGAMELCTERSV